MKITADVPLMEMGDVGSALDLLLRTQAGYVRGGEGVTRAQIDVARHALSAEINRYVRIRAGGGFPEIPPDTKFFCHRLKAECPSPAGCLAKGCPHNANSTLQRGDSR